MKKLVLITLFFISYAFTQSFDAVSLSMAQNYTAHSRGINSMAWNPANLCMPRGNTIELNILSMYLGVYNNALSINSYNQYFTQEGHGGRWSTSDKKEIMDLLDDGVHTNINYSSNLLGFAYNNFAVSIQSKVQGKAELVNNSRLFKTFLFGDSLTRDYAFEDSKFAKGSAYSATKISVGYAYPLRIDRWIDIPGVKTVCIGMNLNYFLGNAVAKTQNSEVSLQRYQNEQEDEIIEYNLNVLSKTAYIEGSFPAGNGFGIDLGFSTHYDKQWHFSWSFENLFGSIHWAQNTETHVLVKRDSALFKDLIDNDAEDTSVSEDTTYRRGSFSTRLPVTMRLGAAYDWDDKLTLTMDWHQGFDTYFGNTSTPQVGIGGEYFALNWLPLRMGMSVGGTHGFLFGIGFGLHAPGFQFDYSYGMNKGMWPTYSRGLYHAFGFKVAI